jgi:hypothetical protein
VADLQKELDAEKLKAQNRRTDTDHKMFYLQNSLETAQDSLQPFSTMELSFTQAQPSQNGKFRNYRRLLSFLAASACVSGCSAAAAFAP